MISPILDFQLSIATGVFLFGLIQLMYRNSGPHNRCMAVALFSLDYVLLYFWAIDTNFIYAMPLLINTDIPVTILAAAGIYFAFTTILSEEESPPVHYKKHFIIPGILLAGTIVFNMVMYLRSGKPYAIEVLTRYTKDNWAMHLFSFLSDLSFFTYTLMAVIKGIRLWKRKQTTHRAYFLFMFAFLCCLQIIAGLFVVFRFIKDPRIIQDLSYLCGILVFIFCIVGFRYPEYTQRVLKTVKSQTRRKQHLDRQNTDVLMAELVSLMEKGKIYTNPVLTLNDVGKLMHIPPTTVSQLINRKAKMNFKSFINNYRIKAICSQLVKHPDISILEIAFGNGFNSKSTFNSAFQEITGKTPREYRKEIKRN